MFTDNSLQLIIGAVDKTKEAFDSIKKNTETLTNKIEAMRPAFKKMAAIGTAGFVAVVGGSIAAATKVGETADRLLDLKEITGISTQTLQEFQQVAREAGVSQEVLSDAASGITRRLSQLEKGEGRAAEAAARLDIEVLNADGSLRSIEGIMLDSIDAMGKMENETERAAIANDLFGRRWEDLAPVAALGAEAIDEARQRAHELGLVMSEEALVAANEFRKGVDTLKAQVGGLTNEFGLVMIPILKDLVEAIQPIITNIIEWAKENPELTRNIVIATAAIFGLLAVVGLLGLALPAIITGFTLLFSPVALIIGIVAALIAIGVLLYQRWDWVVSSLKNLWLSWLTRLEKDQKRIEGILDIIKRAFTKAWEWIKRTFVDPFLEGLNTLLAPLTRIWNMAKDVGGAISGAIGRVVVGGGATSVKDAIITPQGKVIQTDPADWLFATKKPSSLAGGITVNITGNTFMSDREAAEKIGNMLMDTLKLQFNVR